MKQRFGYLSLSIIMSYLMLAPVVYGGGVESVPPQNNEIPSGDYVVTESEAIHLALKRNDNLSFLESDIAVANYQLESAGAFKNPELRVEDSFDRLSSSDNRDVRVSFRWQPPRYGERTEEKLKATVEVSQSAVDSIRYRQSLVSRIRKLYADVVYYNDMVELGSQRVATDTARVQIIEKLVGLGSRTIVYLTKSKMRLAESRHEYAQALDTHKAGVKNLAKVIGKSPNFSLAGEALPIITDDVDVLAEIAFRYRPEIELAEHLMQLTAQKDKVERYKRIPYPTFGDVAYCFDDKQDDRVEFRMGLELPLFNRNTGNIKAMDMAVNRKMNERAAIQEQIHDEVRDAYNQYTKRLADWQNFNQEFEVFVTDNQAVIAQAREHDVCPPDEILELELSLLKTKQLLAEKRQRMAEALAELYFAMGVD